METLRLNIEVVNDNEIKQKVIIDDKRNGVTLLAKPCYLDCGGTIDGTCVVGWDVYIYNGDAFDYSKFVGHITVLNKRNLRRMYTKAKRNGKVA